LLADSAGKKIYVSVGSATNVDEQRVDEKDSRRAAILQVNPDGSGMRVFASGMRNPVGMDWEVKTNRLWTVVNERDMLGDELVPDYLTSVRMALLRLALFVFRPERRSAQKGQRPDLVAKAIKPDYALGSHVAPLGLTFYNAKSFPEHYHGGAFIGMHGSWNRSNLVGYKVAFVPFENGRPNGSIEDFLTGFIVNRKAERFTGDRWEWRYGRTARCWWPTTRPEDLAGQRAQLRGFGRSVLIMRAESPSSFQKAVDAAITKLDPLLIIGRKHSLNPSSQKIRMPARSRR
jgi:glucose/arabinose dehydrogenase